VKPLRTYPRVVRLVVTLLATLLDDLDEAATVAANVPRHWTPTAGTHVQVASDGVPELDHPVAIYPTVRVTVWAADPDEADRVAGICLGLLAGHPGEGGIGATRPLTGPLPARDADTGADLSSVTVRVTVRSVPLIPAAP